MKRLLVSSVSFNTSWSLSSCLHLNLFTVHVVLRNNPKITRIKTLLDSIKVVLSNFSFLLFNNFYPKIIDDILLLSLYFSINICYIGFSTFWHTDHYPVNNILCNISISSVDDIILYLWLFYQYLWHVIVQL